MAIPTSPNKWALKRDLDNYIYFSPITIGTSDQAVKIHNLKSNHATFVDALKKAKAFRK